MAASERRRGQPSNPFLHARALKARALPRVEKVAQSITNQVKAESKQRDKHAWNDGRVRRDTQECAGVGEQVTPTRCGGLNSDPKEAKGGFENNRLS